MARARNIKPSFFTNDILAECSPLARLLFIGLWNIADREGRLEDRPKKIKAEVLPYDECDPIALCDELENRQFIIRYESNNNKYIQVLNFTKHQNPHMKEAASTIPAPCSDGKIQNHPGLNPLPSSPILIPEPPTPQGVLKNGSGKKNGAHALMSYDIEKLLSDVDREQARSAAPGWDLQYLFRAYNAGVPERGEPKSPPKAFIAWCKLYTKENPP